MALAHFDEDEQKVDVFLVGVAVDFTLYGLDDRQRDEDVPRPGRLHPLQQGHGILARHVLKHVPVDDEVAVKKVILSFARVLDVDLVVQVASIRRLELVLGDVRLVDLDGRPPDALVGGPEEPGVGAFAGPNVGDSVRQVPFEETEGPVLALGFAGGHGILSKLK
ncbi:hypothetical protein ACFU6I_46550 [Streptomyces sp. NPDC057486]|uniref:hypothetical protein n=1 Tax=Streptomyces sp. NPDC057486 TaxID=3346145 RepID=UPI0036B167EB